MNIVRGAFLGVFAISVALLFVCPDLPGQTQGAVAGTDKALIEGKISVVSSAGTSNSLPGIAVRLKGPSPRTEPQSTTTDEDGHYEFTQLAPGSYNLEVAA